MTVTIETGAGIRNANSLIDAAFVSAYLTERGREAEWNLQNPTVQDAKVLAAADHMEKRWASLYRGAKQFRFDIIFASATIAVVTVPAPAETLTVGGTVYSFVAALSAAPEIPNEILIGVDQAATAANIVAAIAADPAQAGVGFSNGTAANREAFAEITSYSTSTALLTATAPGESGNSTALATTATGLTLTVFVGGQDGGSQPMSFPRVSLFDRTGIAVQGVPLDAKQAQAEYAERARVADLDPDPDVDPTGASIQSKREKVGPIEEETTYVAGTHLTVTVRPYPAADRLLKQYTRPPGVFR